MFRHGNIDIKSGYGLPVRRSTSLTAPDEWTIEHIAEDRRESYRYSLGPKPGLESIYENAPSSLETGLAAILSEDKKTSLVRLGEAQFPDTRKAIATRRHLRRNTKTGDKDKHLKMEEKKKALDDALESFSTKDAEKTDLPQEAVLLNELKEV